MKRMERIIRLAHGYSIGVLAKVSVDSMASDWV